VDSVKTSSIRHERTSAALTFSIFGVKNRYSAYLINMFPHTYHIECVVKIERQ
jgi:hypothetical protein